MTRDDFWQIVAKLIAKTRGNLRHFTTALHKLLKSLTATEIEEFARHYADLQNEANTSGILEAAYIIGCGPSNDGFMDFRRWIVFQGETHFERIVDNPDYLGSYDPNADPIEHWYCEFHPMWAYEEATGNELTHFDVGVYPDAVSDFDKPQTLAKRYPKLWKRINSKKTTQQSITDRGKGLFVDATLDRIEAKSGSARFIFSSGAQIDISNYWEHYRSRYDIASELECYDEHPMVGKKVVGIEGGYFPHTFALWFENRKKLPLDRAARRFPFRVFDGAHRIDE